MNKDFEIIIGSPVDYEELVAYIVIDGKEVALISQDLGKDNLEVVFPETSESWRVNLDILNTAIAEAKRRLLK